MSTSSIKSTPTVIKSKPPSAGGPSPIGLSRRLDSNDDDDEYEDSSKRSSSEFDSDIIANDGSVDVEMPKRKRIKSSKASTPKSSTSNLPGKIRIKSGKTSTSKPSIKSSKVSTSKPSSHKVLAVEKSASVASEASIDSFIKGSLDGSDPFLTPNAPLLATVGRKRRLGEVRPSKEAEDYSRIPQTIAAKNLRNQRLADPVWGAYWRAQRNDYSARQFLQTRFKALNGKRALEEKKAEFEKLWQENLNKRYMQGKSAQFEKDRIEGIREARAAQRQAEKEEHLEREAELQILRVALAKRQGMQPNEDLPPMSVDHPQYAELKKESRAEIGGIYRRHMQPVLRRYQREFFHNGVQELVAAGATQDQAETEFETFINMMKEDDPVFAKDVAVSMRVYDNPGTVVRAESSIGGSLAEEVNDCSEMKYDSVTDDDDIQAELIAPGYSPSVSEAQLSDKEASPAPVLPQAVTEDDSLIEDQLTLDLLAAADNSALVAEKDSSVLKSHEAAGVDKTVALGAEVASQLSSKSSDKLSPVPDEETLRERMQMDKDEAKWLKMNANEDMPSNISLGEDSRRIQTSEDTAISLMTPSRLRPIEDMDFESMLRVPDGAEPYNSEGTSKRENIPENAFAGQYGLEP